MARLDRPLGADKEARRRVFHVPTLVAGWAALASATVPPVPSDWPGYEGGQASRHYSSLREINRSNVDRLQVAWTYEVGDIDTYAEPLVLPDRLIVVGRGGAVVALDPGTGAELWRTDTGLKFGPMRGFSYWRSRDGSEERVIFAAGHRMRAIDPRTGTMVAGFDVDLRQGLGRDPARIRSIASSTPGRVFENLIILGSATGEGRDAPPGDVRAYDVRDGSLVWTFHTIPGPGEFGHDTWPADARTRSGAANVWGGISVDDARGIAYFVTGSPTYDFYGPDRKGDNLFGNSVVAVDARTGRRLWHFQTVHHDLWDYDLAASPVLLTIRQKGRKIPAVAVAGKTGFLYVFDRVTGRPVWPIPEKPVPASDAPGEHASPTQPMPDWPLPFARQRFTADDLDPMLSPEERAEALERLKGARNEGIFTPPSTRGTVQMPGNHGGANWGMTAGDPSNGRLYVMSGDLPAVLKLTEQMRPDQLALVERARGRGAAVYAANCQTCHGANREGQPPVVPGLQQVTDRMSPADLQKVIREGRGPMPGFPDLDNLDVRALISFMSGSEMPKPPPMPTKPAAAKNPGPPSYVSGFGYLISKAGQPMIEPPWQTLTAYDLNSGKRLWQMPVGTSPGRKTPTGDLYSKAGLVVTAGGLVFAASDADRKLHALDAASGEALWSADLPARPRGGIVTYRHDGRQYVVVPATNSNGLNFSELPSTFSAGTNSYVAFALGERD